MNHLVSGGVDPIDYLRTHPVAGLLHCLPHSIENELAAYEYDGVRSYDAQQHRPYLMGPHDDGFESHDLSGAPPGDGQGQYPKVPS